MQAEAPDFSTPQIAGAEHRKRSGASEVKAWTAGGLRNPEITPSLPPVQLELFTEAGAIVAERAAHAGAGREAVASILRRASQQASRAIEQAWRRAGPT